MSKLVGRSARDAGPLEPYRCKSSIDVRRLKIFLKGGQKYLDFQEMVWAKLEQDPLFKKSNVTLSLPEERRITFLRCKKLYEYGFVRLEEFVTETWKIEAFRRAVSQYDSSLAVKYSLSSMVFYMVVAQLGSFRHYHLLEKVMNFEIIGCIAITEIGHGSNARAIQTTATYDPATAEFVLNTPSFEAAKVWVGNMGKTATHAALFAQLVVPDGTCHGMHGFVVPLRDPNTLETFPGLILGDMGEKLGNNGLDNGFLLFKNYRIPRENLLSRNFDVTSDGVLVRKNKHVETARAASLGALSPGRMGIADNAVNEMSIALVIAVRYAAVRRQFGPVGEPEWPIIEYPLHQYRLFPLLAKNIVLGNFARTFGEHFVEYAARLLAGDKSPDMGAVIREVHALSCVNKAVTTWACQGCIQECREACGGHGYLKINRLGELRNDADPAQTYEGDNNVILQQTANYLLDFYPAICAGKRVSSPLKSVDMLNDAIKWANEKQLVESDMPIVEGVLTVYEWLFGHLFLRYANAFEQRLAATGSAFHAINDTRVHLGRRLPIIYYEHAVIQWFKDKLAGSTVPSEALPAMRIVHELAAASMLDAHLGTLFAEGCPISPAFAQRLRASIRENCTALLPHAVPIADALAPPDFILNSAIGSSDGRALERLYEGMLKTPHVFDRPEYWREFAGDKENSKL